jgi:hypothetical protein
MAKVFEEPRNVVGGIIVASFINVWRSIIGLTYNPPFKPAIKF